MRRVKSWLGVSCLSASLLLVHPLQGLAYQIQPGDSLWSISQQYGVSVSRLEDANGLSDDSILQIGQELTIPGQDQAASSTPAYRGSTVTYSVHSGDNLWDLAQRYGTSVDTLMSVNGLTSDVLQIGQTLRVPGGTGSPAPPAASPAAAVSPRASGTGSPEVSRSLGPTGRVVAYALKFRGFPYSFGGGTPSGFDCSGFVRYVFAAFGINLPHSSYDQFRLGVRVPDGRLEPGDLVFFNTYGSLSHVGIYVGNGQFISATNSRGVAVESIYTGYWGRRYAGARRL